MDFTESELRQEDDGNQQAPTTETTEIAPEKLSSLVFGVINSLQQLGVYICEKYDQNSEKWTKIHEPWSPLAFIKLLLDLHIRCRNGEVGGCAYYKYWIGVEEKRVLMKKFLNALKKPDDANELNTMKALIAKVDHESSKLASSLKDSAIKFESNEERKDQIGKKYKFEKKFKDGKEIIKPNEWDWNDEKVRADNLIIYSELKFKKKDEEHRALRLNKLENEVRLLQHECHALGAAVCNSDKLEVDHILKCVDYWSPVSLIKVLETVLRRTKRKADFWFLQRSCGKLQEQRETLNRFKTIVFEAPEFGSSVDTEKFENYLFAVIKLLFGLAYTDSAALTKNEEIEVIAQDFA